MAASFIIYTDSSNVVNMLTDMEAGLLFKAILAYQSGDEYEPIVKAGGRVLAMAFEHFRQYFVRDAEKYQNVTEARREAGARGAAKRWQKKANDSKNSNCHVCHNLPNSKIAKMADNVNDNDNDNDNDNVSDSDNVSVLTCNNTPTPPSRHERFLQWLADNCPYIAGHYKLPSDVLLAKLINTYGAEAVANECLNIENRTDLRKRYSNLYQTLNNWLKKDYGENRKDNTQGREQRAAGVAALIQRLADEDDQREASASIQPHGRA